MNAARIWFKLTIPLLIESAPIHLSWLACDGGYQATLCNRYLPPETKPFNPPKPTKIEAN